METFLGLQSRRKSGCLETSYRVVKYKCFDLQPWTCHHLLTALLELQTTKRKLQCLQPPMLYRHDALGQHAGFVDKMQEYETLQGCETLKNSHAQAKSELEEVLPSSYNVHPSSMFEARKLPPGSLRLK